MRIRYIHVIGRVNNIIEYRLKPLCIFYLDKVKKYKKYKKYKSNKKITINCFNMQFNLFFYLSSCVTCFIESQ